MKCPSSFLKLPFVWKLTLSNIRIASPVFFWLLVFARYYLFHSFTWNISICYTVTAYSLVFFFHSFGQVLSLKGDVGSSILVQPMMYLGLCITLFCAFYLSCLFCVFFLSPFMLYFGLIKTFFIIPYHPLLTWKLYTL